ncbi:putative Hydroxyproline O-galactosyltransferase GALT5 [Cocos nucifera]|uniref:Putative Hydroxyproline O-galactosyltransferase GALT5 n=1 Tax=Cocos nucifera TaxID=13894 RepID=A0A8K0N3G4_COCNU|nr:putative Hydroxyproline O-galactosyltransferase GALT5 [Cocos nucifera]
MRRSKLDVVVSLSRQRSLQVLLALALLYVAVVFFFEFPFLSHWIAGGGGVIGGGDSMTRVLPLGSEEATEEKSAPARPSKGSFWLPEPSGPIRPRPPLDRRRRHRSLLVSGLNFAELNVTGRGPISELHKSARDAWEVGSKLLIELKSAPPLPTPASPVENRTDERCPHSIVLTGADFRERGRVMVLPCGLTLGSHITLVAKPYQAHPEVAWNTYEANPGMSIFLFRLYIFFNSNVVDGMVKCEKWIRDDDNRSEESKTTWWLNRLIGRTRRVSIDWPYPFVEDKLFVLTLIAGLEGYHVNVDGRHVTSFPYRTGFVLEDATGLSLNGDLDIQSIFAGSLPTSHPSYAPQRHLEWLTEWRALPLSEDPVELFIGILSAGNHFAERMAVRKSWMSAIRKSSDVVARFFVALNGRREVNMELKKEAEFFGDIVIVPFMDSYDLVVLKTIAICEYGVRAVSAKYIMKCDDDTFVRVDAVMNEVKKIPSGRSLYVGNINYYHKPLREGKWAVTYEEWPEEDYPPYANGPGYVVSSDIASFIVSEFEKQKLRGFVLEDATGLSLNGDLDIQSIFAGSLPTSHPSYAPQRHLEWLTEWRALPLSEDPVELFIGILSAGNHFAERMAVRKSWMSAIRKSSDVVARFFVALNGRREVNMELKKEAEFFGDIVIVPFMDSYDLVVLKTIAICEYGVRAVSAKYIMKCDDDTFVRVDAVMNEVKKIPSGRSLYVGNINYYHKPLREGKWAVTYEEWPEEDYPPYANGPGYVVSSDIASFIVSEFEKQKLRLFKMEDVSMGMWVEKFNATRPVGYVNDIKFCQFGCIDNYYTAHYQSPRQMMCLWDKLQAGKPQCCNMR